MGKQKKSKRKYQSDDSSSRRSHSLRRSYSSESDRRKSKKHKSKRDDKQRKQSKQKNSERKQRKAQKRRERSRSYQRQRDFKRQYKQQPKQTLKSLKQQTSVKNENIDNLILKQQQQENRISSPIERDNIEKQEQSKPERQLPCFEPSGILLQYYNAREGVSLRFHQPPQGRQPDEQWRIYVFKGEETLKPIILQKSSYLIGKDDRVVDILAENPSISRQHCVIQFRLIQKRQTQGEYTEVIKPYVMDLESTNGTFLNDERIQSGRYYELLHRDVLKFGFSEREYVIVKWDQSQEQEQEPENQ